MGKKSKRKGREGERQAATLLEGVRTWGHLHDVQDKWGRWWEIKWLAEGFSQVYNALEEHALHYRESGDGSVPSILIRQDHKPWVVAFLAEDWLAGRCNPEGELSADSSGEPSG